MDNNWGGARSGAGRKKLTSDNKKKGCCFQLLQEDIDYIDSLHGRSRSENLRIIIEEHKDLKKRMDISKKKW